MSKTQPDEEEVVAAISAVIDKNPDFGVKRVSSLLKEQNPEWSIGDKRGACGFVGKNQQLEN
jgi:hypothetical protein